MRYTKDEIVKMREEFQTGSKARKNEIFETLSYIARKVVQEVYNEYKAKYGYVIDYEELLMDGYEKLFKILDWPCALSYESHISFYIKTDLVHRCNKYIRGIQKEKKISPPIKDFQDEADWDNIEEAKMAWNMISNNCLNEYNLKIIKLYFGLDGNEPHSQPEIAKMYGTSRQNINDIITNLPKIYKDAQTNLKYKRVFKDVRKLGSSYRESAVKFDISIPRVSFVVNNLSKRHPKYFEENE